MERRKYVYKLLPLTLVLLAAWLRLWQLNTIPPGFWFDEGHNAMDGMRIGETNSWPVFVEGNQGQEPLFKYLLALATTVFGETIYSVRVVSAFLGTLSVALIYRWLLALFGSEARARGLAQLGMAGLATSFVYLVMTRVGYRANTLLPLLLLVYYLFWRGWQTGKIYFYLLAGAGLGLS
ncbi:MAG TPA: glycosyltransferase family 39 protein, partial [Anaerolineae bacterium]